MLSSVSGRSDGCSFRRAAAALDEAPVVFLDPFLAGAAAGPSPCEEEPGCLGLSASVVVAGAVFAAGHVLWAATAAAGVSSGRRDDEAWQPEDKEEVEEDEVEDTETEDLRIRRCSRSLMAAIVFCGNVWDLSLQAGNSL